MLLLFNGGLITAALGFSYVRGRGDADGLVRRWSREDLDKLEELEGEVLEEPFSLSSLDGAIESEEQEEGVSEKSSGMHDTQPDEFLNIGLDEEDNVPDIRRGQQVGHAEHAAYRTQLHSTWLSIARRNFAFD